MKSGQREVESSQLAHTENYYKLYDILSMMKISCLEPHREEAKKKYRAHQAEYVIACLGKPLEKLSVSLCVGKCTI